MDFEIEFVSLSNCSPIDVDMDISMTTQMDIDMGIASQTGFGDKNYVHVQSVASAVWHVTHNLQKYPSVSIVDSAGSIVIGEVSYIDESSLEISFCAPFSGSAYLN